jgi:hypothetical protein
MYENDKKLIAASGLDPSTYESVNTQGRAESAKEGTVTYGG